MEYKTWKVIAIVIPIMVIGIYLLIYVFAPLTWNFKGYEGLTFFLLFLSGITLTFLAIISNFREVKETPDSIHKHDPMRKKFKIAFPFYCDHCNKFTNALLEYCENCGAKNTIRAAIKKDYKYAFKELSSEKEIL
ncbi:MAG: hypothetical protein ACFFA0_05865 [Promethearchaeota archaeon]